MENVGKSSAWRAELHRRAHDGRFQAGAAAAAGAGGAVAAHGIAGIAAAPHKKAAAEAIARRELVLDRGYQASKDGKPRTAGHWLSAAHRRSADAEDALKRAGAISRRGKYAAIAAGGAGALAAAGLVANHHRHQRMVNELEDTASLSKSYPGEVSTMSNYSVDLLFAAARDEEIQKNLVTEAFSAGSKGFKRATQDGAGVGSVTRGIGRGAKGAAQSVRFGAPGAARSAAGAAKTAGESAAETVAATGKKVGTKAKGFAVAHPNYTNGALAGGAAAGVGGAGYAIGRHKND